MKLTFSCWNCTSVMGPIFHLNILLKKVSLTSPLLMISSVDQVELLSSRSREGEHNRTRFTKNGLYS